MINVNIVKCSFNTPSHVYRLGVPSLFVSKIGSIMNVGADRLPPNIEEEGIQAQLGLVIDDLKAWRMMTLWKNFRKVVSFMRRLAVDGHITISLFSLQQSPPLTQCRTKCWSSFLVQPGGLGWWVEPQE